MELPKRRSAKIPNQSQKLKRLLKLSSGSNYSAVVTKEGSVAILLFIIKNKCQQNVTYILYKVKGNKER